MPTPPETSRSEAAGEARPRLRVVGLLTLALAAVLAGALAVPGLGAWLVGLAAGLALIGLGFLALMALGWLGFGLVGAGARFRSWVRRLGSWPDDDPSPPGF